MNRLLFAAVAAPLLTHLHAATNAAGATSAAGASELKIAKGLKISIVGNTLAERMQHDGWATEIDLSSLSKPQDKQFSRSTRSDRH